MYNEYLEFEMPIAELEAKIKELQTTSLTGDVNIVEDIAVLQDKSNKLTKSIFSKLNDHQIVQLARHSLRPHSIDYIKTVFDDFEPLSGDRSYAKSQAIIAGIARLNGNSVMLIAQEKGRETEEKIARNFGMPKPECYRFAKRIMHLAEKFNLPLITMIDTAGAYPGIDAEKHNQSEAIASNLFVMSQLKTPIISVVIGEGGSGGALAIGLADKILMLEYSVFSVISPEGCASILWKNADKSKEAAKQMQLTSDKLKELGLINRIISEPLGGAHRNLQIASQNIKEALTEELMPLINKPHEVLLEERNAKYRSIQTNI
ncbi:MAG: acetyl-CoA carboxylase carboxyltransferase subunit alpha [Legionellales bacterium]|jgi:acetyl-CoA carboxylase carboxyl transferase subunit alpha|nr:acetyl-CoA carboxylase carboxyltransferase subunit alpha [Legionellales bacterium]